MEKVIMNEGTQQKKLQQKTLSKKEFAKRLLDYRSFGLTTDQIRSRIIADGFKNVAKLAGGKIAIVVGKNEFLEY